MCLFLSSALLLAVGCQTNARLADHKTTQAATQSKQVDDTFVRASQNIQGRMNYEWQLVKQIVPDQADQLRTLSQLQGKWVVDNNKLLASQGQANRAILLAPSGHDPVRIELEVSLKPVEQGRIGDITILLNIQDDAKFMATGYALTTGSYWNNCTTFYRQRKALANTQWSPLKPNVVHKVALEYDHGQMRYWLDGRILLETWDYQPLPMTPTAWIGLRTWHTDLTVHGARIYKTDKSSKPKSQIKPAK